jgi:hypothetical protein
MPSDTLITHAARPVPRRGSETESSAKSDAPLPRRSEADNPSQTTQLPAGGLREEIAQDRRSSSCEVPGAAAGAGSAQVNAPRELALAPPKVSEAAARHELKMAERDLLAWVGRQGPALPRQGLVRPTVDIAQVQSGVSAVTRYRDMLGQYNTCFGTQAGAGDLIFDAVETLQRLFFRFRRMDADELSELLTALEPLNVFSQAVIRPSNNAPMVPLGAGCNNTVYRASVFMGEGSVSGVYKADDATVGEEGERAGISKDHPDWSLRSAATSRLNQRLGLNVIPPTCIVFNEIWPRVWERGCLMEEVTTGVAPLQKGPLNVRVSEEVARALQQRPGLLEDFANSKGFSRGEIEGLNLTLFSEIRTKGPDGQENVERGPAANHMDFDDAGLRCELTKLQWLDALTGQIDRHPGNYFIGRDDAGSVRVWGFDNDMAFGNRPLDLDNEWIGFSARLPKVIDQSTFEALRGLKPEDIETACAGLPAAQIEATKLRLELIQDKLLKFGNPKYPNAGKVLPDGPAGWSTPEVSELLGVRQFNLHNPRDADKEARRSTWNAVDEARRTSYVANASAVQRVAHLYRRPTPVYDPAELAAFVANNGAVAA